MGDEDEGARARAQERRAQSKERRAKRRRAAPDRDTPPEDGSPEAADPSADQPTPRARRTTVKRAKRRDPPTESAPEPGSFNPYAPPAEPSPRPKKKSRRRRLRDASKERRFANMVIDSIVVFVISFAALVVAVRHGDARDDGWSSFLFYVLYLAYYIAAEALGGRTVGKLLTRTKVIGENGEPPSFGLVVVRTLIRFVPFDALSFLGGRSGWHDRWSGTRVVMVD